MVSNTDSALVNDDSTRQPKQQTLKNGVVLAGADAYPRLGLFEFMTNQTTVSSTIEKDRPTK